MRGKMVFGYLLEIPLESVCAAEYPESITVYDNSIYKVMAPFLITPFTLNCKQIIEILIY